MAIELLEATKKFIDYCRICSAQKKKKIGLARDGKKKCIHMFLAQKKNRKINKSGFQSVAVPATACLPRHGCSGQMSDDVTDPRPPPLAGTMVFVLFLFFFSDDDDKASRVPGLVGDGMVVVLWN